MLWMDVFQGGEGKESAHFLEVKKNWLSLQSSDSSWEDRGAIQLSV